MKWRLSRIFEALRAGGQQSESIRRGPSPLQAVAGRRELHWWLIGSETAAEGFAPYLSADRPEVRVIQTDGAEMEELAGRERLGQLRQEIASDGSSLRLVVDRPSSAAVALATHAHARGAQIVYRKTEAWETRGSVRLDLEEDSLVHLADHLLADTAALGRLLRARVTGSGIVHLAENSEQRGELLRALCERPSVTVLIAAPELGTILDTTLAALLEQRGGLAYRIAVAVSGQVTEEDEQRFEGWAGPALRLLRCGSPARGAALALAQRATGGEFIVVLSPGQEPLSEDWIGSALEVLSARGEVGAVALLAGPAEAGKAGREQDQALLPGEIERSEASLTPLSLLPEAGFVIRRDVLMAAGGFVEDLPPELADTALSLRIRRCGFSLVGLAGAGRLAGALRAPVLTAAALRQVAHQAQINLDELPRVGES